ncbi:Hypothetical protein SMAX5B_009162 [Scophthalmus maximus]|uniref:Uncharacterized protein n=1 Tax=Scophthalmus maximus TaxID=52904 RepID=A0A2U9C7P4_SCOMX|nr:Hypothetical protein SMAX5B_009162 [Scophthalmus maximus]
MTKWELHRKSNSRVNRQVVGESNDDKPPGEAQCCRPQRQIDLVTDQWEREASSDLGAKVECRKVQGVSVSDGPTCDMFVHKEKLHIAIWTFIKPHTQTTSCYRPTMFLGQSNVS